MVSTLWALGKILVRKLNIALANNAERIEL